MLNESEGMEQKQLHKFGSENNARKYFKAFLGVFFSYFVLMLCIVFWLMNNICFAWFSSNRTVSGNGMSVTVQDPNIVQVDMDNFLIMGYIADNGVDANPRYTFASKSYNEASGSITMVSYDTIYYDNAHAPLVVKLPIKGATVERGEALSIKLSIKEDDNWYTMEDGKKKMLEILSNVLEVKCVVSDSSAQDEELWEAIIAADAPDTQKYIVEWNVENPQKVYSLDFIVSGYTAPREGESLNLYFVISYHDDLVRDYLDKHNASIKFGETVEEISFANDFTNLDVSVLQQ